MSQALAAFVVFIALVGGGCSNTSELDTTSAGTCGDGTDYFLLGDAQEPSWDLKEAVDYPEDLGPLAAVEPSLDWYAEYERFIPISESSGSVEGVDLRLSGHDANLKQHAAELLGFDLAADTINDYSGYVGAGPDGSPSVITMATGDDYTVMLLSYGLSPIELLEVGGRVELVCEQGWIDAGGQILECMPTDADCSNP